MKTYNGLERSFGINTVRVHLQNDKYKGYFDTKICGNCKGADVLDFDFEDDEIDNAEFHNCEIKYYSDGCFRVTIYDGDNHNDWSEQELEPNEMGALVVGIEIIDFKEDE